MSISHCHPHEPFWWVDWLCIFTPILLCPTKGQLWETMMGKDGENTFGTCGIMVSFYKLFDLKNLEIFLKIAKLVAFTLAQQKIPPKKFWSRNDKIC
jgi:hypothetical protein